MTPRSAPLGEGRAPVGAATTLAAAADNGCRWGVLPIAMTGTSG